MLPHGRKDAKMDTKSKLYHLNEVAELYNCNNILFFEARKRQDLYMWLSKAPNGPSIKMHVQNCKFMPQWNSSQGSGDSADLRVFFGLTFVGMGSTHDGGTPLYWKRTQGISANSVF